MPVSAEYGKREMTITRKLTERYNRKTIEFIESEKSDEEIKEIDVSPPLFPILFGSLKVGSKFDDMTVRNEWVKKYGPRVPYPDLENLW